MKRFVVILASFILFISSLFAGAADFFDHRIFEVKLNVPANISNNTLTIADFLQEQVIIDLKKLYNDMPKNQKYIFSPIDRPLKTIPIKKKKIAPTKLPV